MTKSKRIDYLDMAKGIGIILVIIGHVSYVSEPVRQYISTFHMPLFFVISGMILYYKKEEQGRLQDFLKKRFRALMIPYFVCSVCILLIESGRILWKDVNTWENVFRQLLQSLCWKGISVLWFLPALFIAEFVFICLRKKGSHLCTGGVLIILCFITYYSVVSVKEAYTHISSLRVEFCYDIIYMLLRNVFCVSLVGLGYYLAMLLFSRNYYWFIDLLLATGLLTLVVVVSKQNGYIDLKDVNIGNLWYFLLGGISGSAGIVLLCRTLEKFPLKFIYHFLVFLGCNSLLIMVTHLDFRVLYISIIIATRLSNTILQNRVLFCISIVFLVIFIEIVIIACINCCKRILKKWKDKFISV